MAPDGTLIGAPLRSGEGTVIADLDFSRIDKRKPLMDSRGHSGCPELRSLLLDRTPSAHTHERVVPASPIDTKVSSIPSSDGSRLAALVSSARGETAS